MALQVNIQGKTQRFLPGIAMAEGSLSSNDGDRRGRYGEGVVEFVYPDEAFAAAEGSFWVGANQSPAFTGFAYAIQTSFAATVALASLYNQDSPSNPSYKRLILKYIHLICTAAGSTTTSSQIVCALDNGNRFSSVSSGSTPSAQNVNGEVAPTGAKGVLNFGNITATAATGQVRYFGRKVARIAAAPAYAVGDQIILKFGSVDHGVSVLSGTAAVNATLPMPPVVIGPNQTFLLHMWNPANATTAPSFEYEVGWVER